MVDKEKLKKRQPVAWKILSNALLSGRISHAYMFYGQKNPDMSRFALLFAQSLQCTHPDEDGFACQECSNCRLIESESTGDFFWLHAGGIRTRKPLSRKEIENWWKTHSIQSTENKSWRIQKENILQLQDNFSYSSQTDVRRQVYILEEYERATSSASNTLLKFLEEPKEGLTGILCTSAINMVLPTIVSRCQLIPLRPPGRAAMEAEFADLIDDEQLAAILARAGYDVVHTMQLMENSALFELRDAAKAYWPRRGEHGAIVELETGVFAKGKFNTREQAAFFLHCLLYFLEQEKTRTPASIDERELLLESIDALAMPLDATLLIERTACDLRKIRRRYSR